MKRAIRVSVAAAMLAAAMAMTLPGAPADAACSGTDVAAYWDNWDYGAEFVGSRYTCDGDDYYVGQVGEYGGSQGDGYCAVVRAVDSSRGASWAWLGYSCRNDSRMVKYHWNPATTDGWMKICKSWRSWDCSPVEASWGM